MAVAVSGWALASSVAVTVTGNELTVTGEAVGAGGAPALVVIGATALVLAAGGMTAVRRDDLGALWAFAGGLLLVGIFPFAGIGHLLVVGCCVMAGATTVSLPRAWHQVWFLFALAASLAGVASLVLVRVPGYLAVMGPVGCSIVLGTGVSVVGASAERPAERDGKPIERVLLRAASRRSVEPLLAGVARAPRWRRVWALVAVWATAAAIFHFGGRAVDFYGHYPWWDTFAHAFSGFGVAGILYLLGPDAFGSTRRLLVVLPALVLVVGAAFEVYEYVFTPFFYQPWTTEKYLLDTLVDIVANTTGAGLFAFLPFTGLLVRLGLKTEPKG